MQTPEHLQSLLRQFSKLAEDGALGFEAQSSAAEYASLPSDMDRAAKYLADFYSDADETNQARDYLAQIMVVAYRDAKKEDPELGASFANAFIADFPGTTGTALLPRWTNLAESCFGFKAVAHSGNRSLVWQHSSRLVLAMNEFLDGLIGILILAWRCALGRDTNPNLLGNPYGSKVHELSELTNGEDGVFYLIFRLAKPKLRNGLAHGNAWPDYEAGVIRFTEGRQDRTEHHLNMIEFMALVKLGCDLARAYIAALAAILLLESGRHDAVSEARQHLVTLWEQ